MEDLLISAGVLVAMSVFTFVTIKWSHLWRPDFTIVEYIVGILIFTGFTHLAAVYGLVDNAWLAYEDRLRWHCFVGTVPVLIGYIILHAKEKSAARAIRRDKEQADHGITST